MISCLPLLFSTMLLNDTYVYMWLNLQKPSLTAHFVFPEILMLNIGSIVAHWCYKVATLTTQYK